MLFWLTIAKIMQQNRIEIPIRKVSLGESCLMGYFSLLFQSSTELTINSIDSSPKIMYNIMLHQPSHWSAIYFRFIQYMLKGFTKQKSQENLLELLQNSNQNSYFADEAQFNNLFGRPQSRNRSQKERSFDPHSVKNCQFCNRAFQIERYDIHTRICKNSKQSQKKDDDKLSKEKPSKKSLNKRIQSDKIEKIEKGSYRLYSPSFGYIFDF